MRVVKVYSSPFSPASLIQDRTSSARVPSRALMHALSNVLKVVSTGRRPSLLTLSYLHHSVVTCHCWPSMLPAPRHVRYAVYLHHVHHMLQSVM